MNKILVTGAAGRHGGTGTLVVEELMHRSVSVRAMVRTEDERAEGLRSLGVEVVVGDFLRVESLLKAADGVSGIYFSIRLRRTCSPPRL